MPKYHFSSSGQVAECKAERRACPLGGVHYSSFEEAQLEGLKLHIIQNHVMEYTSDGYSCICGFVPDLPHQFDGLVEVNEHAKSEHAKEEAEAEAAFLVSSSFVHQELFRNVKKMPALFVIDRTAHKATTDVNEAAAWVFSEPAKATIKRDGTSITVDEDGKVWARRAVKKGKTPPPAFIPAETDSFTGHTFGLEPVEQSGFHKMFVEAVNGGTLPPGTYELCGPKVNGNPEGLSAHRLLPHGEDVAVEIPDMRGVSKEDAFTVLEPIFSDYKTRGIEGVVWWGSDGKRAKLRVKDFFGDPFRR